MKWISLPQLEELRLNHDHTMSLY